MGGLLRPGWARAAIPLRRDMVDRIDAGSHPGKLAKPDYLVAIRGEVPANLVERISALHALCILQRKADNPPAETENAPDTIAEGPGPDAAL